MSMQERLAGIEERLALAEARIGQLEQKPAIPTIGPAPAWPPLAAEPVNTFFDRCPCNPKNGGTGVCGCILGGTKVTC